MGISPLIMRMMVPVVSLTAISSGPRIPLGCTTQAFNPWYFTASSTAWVAIALDLEYHPTTWFGSKVSASRPLIKAFHRQNLPYFILLCFIMFSFYRKFAGKTNVTDFSFSNIYAKRVRTSRFVLSFLSDPRCRFLYIFRISPYTHLAKVQRWFLFFYIIL